MGNSQRYPMRQSFCLVVMSSTSGELSRFCKLLCFWLINSNVGILEVNISGEKIQSERSRSDGFWL